MGPHEKKKKNRYANPENWKRNSTKRARNSGESYINATGKIVPKKVCQEFDCNCPLSCAQKITFIARCKNFEKYYITAPGHGRHRQLFLQAK